MEKRRRIRTFTSEETSVLCQQLVMFLNSGVSLHDGIYMLYEEAEDKKAKEVFCELHKCLQKNKKLYEAMEASQAFSAYMIHMVRAGEYSGKLEDVLHALTEYYERESNIKRSIRNAVIYPVTLFFMMAMIIFVLVWKILPLFQAMFYEINAEISSATEKMMSIGMVAGTVIAIITVVVLILLFVLLLWYRTDTGKTNIHIFFSKFKVTRKLSEDLALEKFISCMSFMVSGGMGIEESLDIAEELVEHSKIKAKIIQCRCMVKEKRSLEEALKDSGLLMGLEGRMLRVAGKTGATDTVFMKLSNKYNDRNCDQLNKLSTVIETLLVVSLSVLVGGVLISVMLPLASIISSIG